MSDSRKRTAHKLRQVRIVLSVIAVLLGLAAALFALLAAQDKTPISLDEIPAYTGEAYVEINGNVPFFTEDDWTTDSFETYSELDALGRCGVAYANVCLEIMPTEPRGRIGSVKPSGWHTVRYNGLVEGNYLYNRCHLIGYQLAGENANPKNLITGTRYLNTVGMLPFENEVKDYVDETDNHVLYRVTPIFEGSDLVASGVLMEAYSVEDRGALSFCVYCYNVQPGIEIDYATGASWRSGETPPEAASAQETDELPEEEATEAAAPVTDEAAASDAPETTDSAESSNDEETVWITASGTKFHRESCRYAADGASRLSRADAEAAGYVPCGICKP